MSKKVLCEIEGFKGFVHFAQPLNLEQVFAIEDAQDKAIEIEPSAFLTKLNERRGTPDTVSWSSRVDVHIIPAIVKCVDKFEIEGLPEKLTLETFPATPRSKATAFVSWCFNQLMTIYAGEQEVPNAS